MKSRATVFNGFLVVLVLALVPGCSTNGEGNPAKKQLSNVRIHVETGNTRDHSSAIQVIRSSPISLNIERDPVLNENHVMVAKVEEQHGGYVIRIKFNRQGDWILERTTVMYRGRHLAIHSDFGISRWIAAPLITGKNSTGELVFTPDCTREETERFVRGLNNMVKKIGDKDNWPFSTPVDQ